MLKSIDKKESDLSYSEKSENHVESEKSWKYKKFKKIRNFNVPKKIGK
jgi:hypothetical protein